MKDDAPLDLGGLDLVADGAQAEIDLLEEKLEVVHMAALKIGDGDDRLPLADEEADAGGEREVRPRDGLGPDRAGDGALVGFLDIDIEAEPGEEGRGLAARQSGEVGHAARFDAGARREHDRVPVPGELAGERSLGDDGAGGNLAVVEPALLG